MVFERGTVERTARGVLADRIAERGGAVEPFAVATRQILKLRKTAKGRRTILRLAKGEGTYMAKKGKKAKRKGKRWGPGNPLWDWQHGRKTKKAKKASNPGPARAKAPGLGVAYRSAWVGYGVAAPVYDEVSSRVIEGRSLTEGLGPALGRKVLTSAYGVNLAVVAADEYIDKRVRQANAMARNSATAIIPELYLLGVAVDEARAQGGGRGAWRTVPQRLSKARNAYDPAFNATSPGGEFRTYRVLKHGLQIARVVANRTRIGQAISRPIKKGLSAIGATF